MRSSAVGFRLQPDWDKAERDKAIWFHEYSSIPQAELKRRGIRCRRTHMQFFFRFSVLKLYSAPHAVTRIFQAADVEFSLCHPVHRAHLSCMDIGPGGDLGLSSSSEKSVYLWETGTGEIRRKLEGHVGEVYSCRFFPSGLTALTAGADMQLKIWCLLTGTCAATLAPGIAGAVTGTSSLGKSEPGGHRSGILDTGIIYRGRNVISIDRLGWMRLWDVTTQVGTKPHFLFECLGDLLSDICVGSGWKTALHCLLFVVFPNAHLSLFHLLLSKMLQLKISSFT
ncbi:unnamed protein product [Dicrocoelium dendriticum]|nr:unnamed protein product [Dicrocoelium dendriticum]